MKKIVLILLCFITLNNTFASSKKSKEKDQYYTLASDMFRVAVLSEDKKERDEAINDMVEYYTNYSEFKEAANEVYQTKKESLEGLKGFEKLEEYKGLLKIGSILGLK